jgi:alkylation response protein AidB-like acyl-CoA dehydrogenase
MSLLIEARLLRATGERALGARGDTPGALSSLIKLGWSRLGVQLARFAVDAEGPEAMVGGSQTGAKLLESCSYAIAGGTTEVLKGIIAERALGLPR